MVGRSAALTDDERTRHRIGPGWELLGQLTGNHHRASRDATLGDDRSGASDIDDAGAAGQDHSSAQDGLSLVLLEVYKFVLRVSGEDAADQVLARMMCSPIQPLQPLLAVRAARMCLEHRLATADAIIFAHAEDAGLPLVTCDAHFEGLPGVEYHSKSSRRS